MQTGGSEDDVLLPIRGSNYVARVPFDIEAEEHGRRQVSGFFFLIEKRFNNATEQEFATYVRMLNEAGTIPLALTAVDQLAATSEEVATLRRGEIVTRDVDGDDETYIKRLGRSDLALVIGPVPNPWIASYSEAVVIGILGIIFAVAVFVWLRPLTKDLRALDRGVVDFGAGQLDTRVETSSRTPVRNLAETFNGMAERITGLIRAQKELTDAVSHELRTPISRLRFGLYKLEHSSDHDAWESAMHGIQQDIDELDQLVDELLTYSRLKDSAPALMCTQVDVEPWLETLVDSVADIRPDVVVQHSSAPSVGVLSFDSRLLRRAVGNLLANAVRHAHERVEVSTRRESATARIVVDDDGIGIPEEQRERIFEPFFRLDEQRPVQQGYGLGLAIVKRICEWHCGKVTASESPLGGARFVIEIPDTRPARSVPD